MPHFNKNLCVVIFSVVITLAFMSAATAVQQAMARWIRVKANMSLRAYEIFQAESAIPDQVWPDLSFAEITRIAFKDRMITSPDHPVIKRLRG